MDRISICIPTYNRAESLRTCLTHLRTFASQAFEVIVGDNASSDHTAEVLREFDGAFSRLVAIRRPQNIGFARNMDGILRRATRDYVYVLSDDDLVYEQALLLMQSILDASADVVAITGRYDSVRKPDAAVATDYGNAVATVIAKNQHAGLFSNLSVCDGHPFMRREIFTRHCAYHDRTGALIPLYVKLLQHGNLVVVDKPIFQHVTSTVSLTTSMTEAWFIDMGMADLEIAKASLPGEVDGWNLWQAKAQLSRLFYFQAARMAWNKGDHALLWLFLNRCKAAGAVGEELLVKCEYAFIHDFIVQRLARMIGDAGCEQVSVTESNLFGVLLPALRAQLPTIGFTAWDPRAPASGSSLLLCDRAERWRGELPPGMPLLAVVDVFETLRLTRHAAVLALNVDRLALAFAEPDALELLRSTTGSFQRLCAPYSAAA